MTRRVLTPLLAVATALLAAGPARAADACPNAAYRTGAGADLPDCRAWEQVSPVEKNSINVYGNGQVFPAGDLALFAAPGPIAPSDGSPLVSTYVATRAETWSTVGTDAGFDPTGITLLSTIDVSDDLQTALVVSTRKLAAGGTDGASNVYLHDLRDRSYRFAFGQTGTGLFDDLTTQGPDRVFGESPDLSHFAIRSRVKLTADAPDDRENLFEWDGSGLRLASIRPDGQPNPDGVALLDSPKREPRDAHLVSTDGRRLTMTLPPDDSMTVARSLYQRVDGRTTTLISRSHRRDDDPSVAANVGADSAWASPNGEEVTFSTSKAGTGGGVAPLTADSGTGGNRIYRWSADGDRLVDLLAGLTTLADPDVQRIVHQSADGRFVWFLAFAPLTGDATQTGGTSANLFLLDTVQRRLSFVAATGPDPRLQLSWSESGRRLAMLSPLPLTGFDNGGAACNSRVDYTAAGRCDEVFAYDAADPAAGFTCASCGPPGSADGNAMIGRITAGEQSFIAGGRRVQAITDDGHVFFDTPSRLVAQDANALADVYEHAPGGGLSLLTTGSGDRPSTFSDVGADGRDVFFNTGQRLVDQDTDDLVDLYTARVGGGLPGQQSTAPRRSCSGDGCRDTVPGPVPRPVAGEPSPATRPAATFTLRRPTRSAWRAAARTGRLSTKVRVSRAGAVRVRARARTGRRSSTVGSAARTAKRASTVAVTIRLSKAAREQLRRKGRLRVTLTATFTEVSRPQSVTTTLTRTSTRTTKGIR